MAQRSEKLSKQVRPMQAMGGSQLLAMNTLTATTTVHEPLHPAADCADDFNSSVAGEEDPGAALDLIDPITEAADAWCPWPRERPT